MLKRIGLVLAVAVLLVPGYQQAAKYKFINKTGEPVNITAQLSNGSKRDLAIEKDGAVLEKGWQIVPPGGWFDLVWFTAIFSTKPFSSGPLSVAPAPGAQFTDPKDIRFWGVVTIGYDRGERIDIQVQRYDPKTGRWYSPSGVEESN